MAPPMEVRHTLDGPPEINLDLNADTRRARSRAISRLTLRQRIAPGLSGFALLAGAGEGFSGVPPGTRTFACPILSARHLPAVPGGGGTPGRARSPGPGGRVGRLAGAHGSA